MARATPGKRAAAKKSTRKTATSTATKKRAAQTTTSDARAKTGPAGRGADWKAAREVLTAHRTLARAERRESELGTALTSHAKTIAALEKQTKKSRKVLDAARTDLRASVKARKKAADRLSALEHATPKTTAATTTKTKRAKKTKK